MIYQKVLCGFCKNSFPKDNDGRLSFDEFLKMHSRYQWMLKELTEKYSGIVPHPTNTGITQKSKKLRMRPKNVPWLMPLLTFVQVVFQIYFESRAQDHDIQKYCRTNGTLCNVLQFDRQKKFQLWRFVTYMLAHSGIGHMIGNMFLQLLLGVPLEIYNGWRRVLVVYLAGGVAGCLGQGVFGSRRLRGASAGDYALLTAHIASVVMVSLLLSSGLKTLQLKNACQRKRKIY
jgi:membrane associated rhomboid family serine protease